MLIIYDAHNAFHQMYPQQQLFQIDFLLVCVLHQLYYRKYHLRRRRRRRCYYFYHQYYWYSYFYHFYLHFLHLHRQCCHHPKMLHCCLIAIYSMHPSAKVRHERQQQVRDCYFLDWH